MTASRHPVQNVEKKRLPIRAVHIWHGGFCSKDFGKGASGPSVLDCANRKWLSEEFGIRFVTLRELADMVAA